MKIKLILIIIFLSNLVSAQVIITEVMPNPKGQDKDIEPNGEWVELYNNGNEKVKISDYILYDSEDKNELYINTEYIGAKEYLVIYRNKDSDFTLNNNKDKVRLFFNGTLIDEVSYSNSKEGMSKALTSKGWFDQIPTPGKENYEDDQSNKCDWKVEILLDSLILDKPLWKFKISKELGEGNRINLYRKIIDMENKTVKEYKVMEFEAKKQKTVKNTPRLKPGTYLIYSKIESLGCEDFNSENDEFVSLIYIKGNITKKEVVKTESLNITVNSCEYNETFINEPIITGKVVYESNDNKAKRYGLYFFCFLLILMIITLKVEKNEKTGSHCKNDFRSIGGSKGAC